MNKTDMHIPSEQYNFIKIPKKNQNRILNILSYCKEIRDTAYPMKNSQITELKLVEFTARKEKDLYYLNGTLSLIDGDKYENRNFEAYIFEDKIEGKVRVYMDITRLFVEDEPKMIRTSEDLIEDETHVMTVTIYATSDSSEEKIFSAEFPKNSNLDFIYQESSKQLSAL